MKIDKRHLLNYSILIPYFILSIIGLVMVYSTTSATQIINGGNPFRTVINQAAFWVVSLIAIYTIYRMKLSFLRKKAVIYSVIFIEIVLLAISRLFTPINGAHGWIPVPGIGSLQPAEYLKLIREDGFQESLQIGELLAFYFLDWLPLCRIWEMLQLSP